MAVYFVYRCHYGSPSEKHVRRFEYDTVLDWAKAVFKQFDNHEDADKYAMELMGGLHVYSFASIFEVYAEISERAPPKTMKDVHAWFGGMYVKGQKSGPHHIQIHTDDDELEMAVYIFDDHYRKENPGKADFLLHDDWQLPDGTADGTFKIPMTAQVRDIAGVPKHSAPSTYAVFLAFYNSSNLDLEGGCRIANMHLPDLAPYMLTNRSSNKFVGEWEWLEIALDQLLKSPKGADAGFLKAISKQPAEQTNWGAYSDWLQERGEPTAGVLLLRAAMQHGIPFLSSTKNIQKENKDLLRVTPHMVQACFHTARWGEDDLYHQWIFFDDRWAAAHPTLAAGILTFASRWDVLS